MLDNNLVETIRSKYQFEMKRSVIILSKLLSVNHPELNVVDKIDEQVELFSKAKEKARHFEDIVKTLSNVEEDEE